MTSAAAGTSSGAIVFPPFSFSFFFQAFFLFAAEQITSFATGTSCARIEIPLFPQKEFGYPSNDFQDDQPDDDVYDDVLYHVFSDKQTTDLINQECHEPGDKRVVEDREQSPFPTARFVGNSHQCGDTREIEQDEY